MIEGALDWLGVGVGVEVHERNRTVRFEVFSQQRERDVVVSAQSENCLARCKQGSRGLDAHDWCE